MENEFYSTFGILPYQSFFQEDACLSNSLIFDFFDTMVSIYIKDISTLRNEHDKNTLEISVPVVNIDIFNSNKILFEKLANFVSGEKWVIDFVKIDKKELPDNSMFFPKIHDSISLLSGGLDSFCGSFEEKNNNTLFVGFKINVQEMNRQKQLSDFLKKINPKTNLKLKKFQNEKIKKEVYTQRTRSLLFLALGIYYADFYDLNEIKLYENGVLSLNPDFKKIRKTTKTTHPKTVHLYNDILNKVGIGIQIKHPFLFKTKGEIVGNLDLAFQDKIKDTMTCGMGRQNPMFDWEEGKQCGICIACILRKISISANDLEEYDAQYDVEYSRTTTKEEFIKIDTENRKKMKSYNPAKEKRYLDYSNKKYTEYVSSLYYFKLFKEKIDENTIEEELELNPLYYNNEDFYDETIKMLKKFSEEVGYFIEKYNLL